MFIITDQGGAVQDIATEKANLSRGKAYKKHKVVKTDLPVRIGDKIKNGKVIKGEIPVNYEILIQNEIEDMNRKTAISRLKNKGKIPPTFRG